MSMWKQTCENRLANEIGCQLFTPCTLFGKIYPRAIGVVYKCTNTRMIQHIIPLKFAWKAIRDLIINPTPISTVYVQISAKVNLLDTFGRKLYAVRTQNYTC
jgi:hypothetical protein